MDFRMSQKHCVTNGFFALWRISGCFSEPRTAGGARERRKWGSPAGVGAETRDVGMEDRGTLFYQWFHCLLVDFGKTLLDNPVNGFAAGIKTLFINVVLNMVLKSEVKLVCIMMDPIF